MNTHSTESAPDEEVCGESFDHDAVTIYEDEDVLQWECRRCGAEVIEEKAALAEVAQIDGSERAS